MGGRRKCSSIPLSGGGRARRIAFKFGADDINAMTRQNYLRAASVVKKVRPAPVANKEGQFRGTSISAKGKLTDVTRFCEEMGQFPPENKGPLVH